MTGPSPEGEPTKRPRSAGLAAGLAATMGRVTTLDLRSVALLRIALGLVILGDLAGRLPELRAHYTDAGALPRDAAGPVTWLLGLYFLDGGAWLPGLLFALTALAAGLLLLGYRTRAVAPVCWFLLRCLHERNKLVLHAGDLLLTSLLLWASFLPLGARASLRARRGGAAPARWQSPAALGLVLQVVLLYLDTAIRKLAGGAWPRGDGVYGALSTEYLVTAAGQALYPHGALLTALNHGTLALELAAAPLLVLSAARPRLRVGLVGGMVVFHLALAATLRLGTFPFVCIAAWLALLPSAVWQRGGATPTPVVKGPPRRWERAAAALGGYLALATALLALGGADPLLLAPGRALGLRYRWAMFVRPADTTGAFVTAGTTREGASVPLLVAADPRAEARAPLAGAPSASLRWRKYFERLGEPAFRDRTAPYLRYACGAGPAPLASARLLYVAHAVGPRYERGPTYTDTLGSLACP
jgi:hypothetical protein